MIDLQDFLHFNSANQDCLIELFEIFRSPGRLQHDSRSPPRSCPDRQVSTGRPHNGIDVRHDRQGLEKVEGEGVPQESPQHRRKGWKGCFE